MSRTKVDMPPERDVLRETLADEAHKAWIGAMSAIVNKVEGRGERTILDAHYAEGCIREALVERWKRQMSTPFQALEPEEQQPLLHHADVYIRVVLFTIARLGLPAVLNRLADEASAAGNKAMATSLRAAGKKVS